jgi:hypothetical protein
VGTVTPDVIVPALEHTAKALEVAMKPGLDELTAMRALGTSDRAVGQQPVDATVAPAQAEIPAQWGASKKVFDTIIACVVRRVWFYTWRFTVHASNHTAWHAFHIASELHQPDPWAPWVGLFRIGLWPLADDGAAMTVYEPPMTGDERR